MHRYIIKITNALLCQTFTWRHWMCLKMAVCLFSEKTSKRINLCLDCQHSCDLYHKIKYILNLLSCMSHPRAVCNNSAILIFKTCILSCIRGNITIKILQLWFSDCILTRTLVFTRNIVFFIYCGERKKEWLKLTIHYRKMDADCPVPRRMSVIVDGSTQVWKSARGHHLLLLLLTRTSTQLWCTSWTLTHIERSLPSLIQ